MQRFLRLLFLPAFAFATACTPATDTDIDVDVDSSAAASVAVMEASEGTASSEMSEGTTASVAATQSAQAASVEAAAPRLIVVAVSNWQFAPATVNVKKGEKVTLRFSAQSGVHGVAVPGLKLNVQIPAGDSIDVTLPTDTTGTFAGFCNIPCGPGHRDMKFTVVVS